MTQQFRNEDMALKEYVKLEGMYQGLIARANDALGYIEGLTVTRLTTNVLEIDVLGKAIIIQFNIVFADPENPLGQITSTLIKNSGSSLESREPLLSQWFDYLGNVKSTSPTDNSGEHIEQNNYLSTFVYKTIRSILSSNEMAPNINNG